MAKKAHNSWSCCTCSDLGAMSPYPMLVMVMADLLVKNECWGRHHVTGYPSNCQNLLNGFQ